MIYKKNSMPLTLKDTQLLIQTIELRSMSYIEIERICGKPNYADADEWIYTLHRSIFGLFSKKLHFYFLDGKVDDYCVQSYITRRRSKVVTKEEKYMGW